MHPQAKGCQQPPEAGRDKEQISYYSLQMEDVPTDTLILDFGAPELWENKFLLCEATNIVVICYSLYRKLIEYSTASLLVKTPKEYTMQLAKTS